MPEPLKPQFFVLRQNGSLVPLIAMDEIPHNIRVADVPRSMTIQDTVGMMNIGQHPSRHRHHVILDTNNTPNRFDTVQFLDTLEPNSDEDMPSTPAITQPVDLASVPRRSYGIVEQPPSSLEAPTSTTPTDPPKTSAFGGFEPLPPWHDPSELGPRSVVPGKKVYCTHWMSTGECDYAQQGCLYKHVMPLNLKTLNDLGYQDIPKWYREKHGIGKLTATPGSGAAIVGPNMKSCVTARGTATATWNGFAGANRSPGEQIPTPSRLGRRDNTGRLPSRRGLDSQTRQDRGQPSTSPDFKTTQPTRANEGRTTSNPLNQSRYATSTASATEHTRHQLPPRPTVRSSSSTTLTPPIPSQSASSPTLAGTPTTSTTYRVIHTNNNTVLPPTSSPFYSSPASARRRSSLYSDPEADIIRENDLRKEKEEREYEAACAARRVEQDAERKAQMERENAEMEE